MWKPIHDRVPGFDSSAVGRDRADRRVRDRASSLRVEGRDFIVHWRFADGRYERLPALAAELVRLNVDVIVAATTLSVQAARLATKAIPIVMVAVPDPIGEGFAASLSRPGGNITGLSNIVTEVSVKHLELLHAAVPKLSRVAVLINPLNPSDGLILEQIHGAAYARGLKVFPVEASTASQLEAGYGAMTRVRAEGLIVAADSFFDVQRNQIAELAIRNRIPTIFSNREMTEAGGLMSYGQNLAEHYRRAALYVDKIMKGAKPGDLPIERPTILEFVINRTTAKALGAHDTAGPGTARRAGDRMRGSLPSVAGIGYGLIWPRISPPLCASL